MKASDLEVATEARGRAHCAVWNNAEMAPVFAPASSSHAVMRFVADAWRTRCTDRTKPTWRLKTRLLNPMKLLRARYGATPDCDPA